MDDQIYLEDMKQEIDRIKLGRNDSMDLKIDYTLMQNGAKKRFELATNHLSTYHYRGGEYDVGVLTKEKLLVLIDELNKENEELKKTVTDLECEIKDIKNVLNEYNDYFCELEVI